MKVGNPPLLEALNVTRTMSYAIRVALLGLLLTTAGLAESCPMGDCCESKSVCCCSGTPTDMAAASSVACYSACQHPPGTDEPQLPFPVVFKTAVQSYSFVPLPRADESPGIYPRALYADPPFLEKWHIPPEAHPNPPPHSLHKIQA